MTGVRALASGGIVSGLLVMAVACSHHRQLTHSQNGTRSLEVIEGVRLPTPRGGHAAGVVRGHVVAAGGNNWTADRSRKEWLRECLVFRDGQWMPGPDLPHAVAYAMSAYDRTGLYLAGGADDSQTLSAVYRLAEIDARAAWTPLTPLPDAVSAGTAAIVADRLFVFCGERDQTGSSRCYSLSLRQPGAAWRTEPALPGRPRAYAASVVIGKWIYVLGGIGSWSPLEALRDAYRFHAERRVWEALPELPWSGYAWSAAAMNPTQILIAGRADGEIHADIEILDLETFTGRKIGEAVIQTTTAPLIEVAPQEWWLIGGEPDSNKTRTGRVSVIREVPTSG
jgi:N-acetylneuraminic acid mutarotase